MLLSRCHLPTLTHVACATRYHGVEGSLCKCYQIMPAFRYPVPQIFRNDAFNQKDKAQVGILKSSSMKGLFTKDDLENDHYLDRYGL